MHDRSVIEHTVTLPAIPSDLDAFLTLREAHARTPHGGAAMFALALIVYARDRDVGSLCVLVSTRSDLLDTDPNGYRGKRLRRARALDLAQRVGATPHIARSYAQGTTPEDGYQLAQGPLTIRVREQPGSVGADGRAKMYVWSTGAPSPRPISLERNDKGIWKAFEWSSLEVGVQAPPAGPGDEL